MKKPFELLILSDYNANTGYATVMKNLKPIWKKYFGPDVHITICACNYTGDLFYEHDGTGEAIRREDGRTGHEDDTLVCSAIKSAQPPPHMDDKDFNEFLMQNSFGMYSLLNLVNIGHFDGIFIMQDVGIVCPIAKMINAIREEKKLKNMPLFKTIFYFPVDCKFSDLVVRDIEFYDLLVTYTEFGRNEILELKPEVRKKMKVVPHGINQYEFFPLPKDERAAFRESYFRKLADKFIVLNLNRNQHRKDIPCTLYAFAEFKKEHPDALLYLHMNPRDHMGWDIRALCWQMQRFLGVRLEEGKDYVLPPPEIENHGAGVDLVNKIYNAADVYLTTTRGEGWGLGITEAMACRLPVVAPLHTSIKEIGDHGRRIYPLTNFYPTASRDDNILRDECDYLEVADQLCEVYNDIKQSEQRLIDKVNAAEKYVHTLHWEDIAKRWIDIFKETY